jgi:NAD(P)-dependent dehydrogenase (short-subunit alcohol dehydrogenase family)
MFSSQVPGRVNRQRSERLLRSTSIKSSASTCGTLFTVQKALPLFTDGGSIFLKGSMASIKGFAGFGVYSASKAAVRSFARTWLVELKERKIRVNILSPGDRHSTSRSTWQ